MLIFQIIFVPVSNASSWDDIFKKGDEFLKEGEEQQVVTDAYGNVVLKPDGSPETITDPKLVKDSINEVYNVLFTLGVAISVIVGAALGIKFMVGSIEEQVKVKETLIPYIVGCVVVFGAFGIWKLVMTLGGKVFI